MNNLDIPKKEKTWALKFSEQQQELRLDNGFHPEGGPDFVTVLEYCTAERYKMLLAYIYRIRHDRITLQYVFRSIAELSWFISNLSEHHLTIKKK